MLGKARDELASHPGGSRNTPSPFMQQEPRYCELWSDGLLGSYADLDGKQSV